MHYPFHLADEDFRPMLFFDDAQFARMKAAFARGRWPGYCEECLLQSAPCDFSHYEALIWNGRRFVRHGTVDVKFGVWILTENSVAFALSGDSRYLDHAMQWARAALATPIFDSAKGYRGNRDLFYGHTIYGLAMFDDLCGEAIDPSLRRAVREKIFEESRIAVLYYRGKDPTSIPYTQNHPYIQFSGLLTACALLRADYPEVEEWLPELLVYPRLILEGMGTDGVYYEGFDYYFYSFVWLVKMVDICERHFGMQLGAYGCFTHAKDYMYWNFFPEGAEYFNTGDCSHGMLTYHSWEEYLAYPNICSDTHLQSYTHVLHWIGARYGDAACHTLADRLRERGQRLPEGFWALAWDPRGEGESPAPLEMPKTHHFSDFDYWFADSVKGEDTLRLMTKCGAPMGRSLPTKNGVPTHNYHAGHAFPEAGCVYAALNDIPILWGPGYMGRKSCVQMNVVTFNAEGQWFDRRYAALNSDLHPDYNRFLELRLAPGEREGRPAAHMDTRAAYPDHLDIVRCERELYFSGDLAFAVEDTIDLKTAQYVEARFGIVDPATEMRANGATWRIGKRVFEMEVVSASCEFDLFYFPREVITSNNIPAVLSGMELGPFRPRGYMLMVRTRQRVTSLRWTVRFTVRV